MQRASHIKGEDIFADVIEKIRLLTSAQQRAVPIFRKTLSNNVRMELK